MRRTLAALGLAALLAPMPHQTPLDPLWTLLSSLWGGSDLAKEGCSWDPSGRCNAAPQSEPATEAGCEWDPSGRCLATQPAEKEAGCSWDPNGRLCS